MNSLTYTVEEAAQALQIGRSAAYEAVRRGDIPSIRIGRSLRVPRHRLEAMLDQNPDPQNDNGAPARSAAVKEPAEQGRREAAD